MTLRQRITFWAYRIAFLLAGLPGCALFKDAVPPSRAACYFVADQHAQARVDHECRIGDAGVSFAECPAHDEIMAELAAAQKNCP